MPLYCYLCPHCDHETNEFEHRPIRASKRHPKCPQCGRRMNWQPGTPMIITNSAWISHGKPSNPKDRWLDNWKQEQKKIKSQHPLDRHRAKKEKEEGEERIRRGGKKIIVTP